MLLDYQLPVLLPEAKSLVAATALDGCLLCMQSSQASAVPAAAAAAAYVASVDLAAVHAELLLVADDIGPADAVALSRYAAVVHYHRVQRALGA